jgi:hypothetical protein
MISFMFLDGRLNPIKTARVGANKKCGKNLVHLNTLSSDHTISPSQSILNEAPLCLEC